MPDKPGVHPEDSELFSHDQVPFINLAVGELSWLLERRYSIDSALKLVGDRHQLRERQRMAVRRSSCSNFAREQRNKRRVNVESVECDTLWIDGFNLLITFATAMRGGLILRGRDGVLRDLASSHRLVLRTPAMLEPIATILAKTKASKVNWVLDKPVSNSAKVGQTLTEFAQVHQLSWDYTLDYNPDMFLISQGGPVVTSDAMILDAEIAWVDLLSPLVEGLNPPAWVVSFDGATVPLTEFAKLILVIIQPCSRVRSHAGT